MDRNNYYGGESASLSLQQVCTSCRRGHSSSEGWRSVLRHTRYLYMLVEDLQFSRPPHTILFP